MINITNIYSIGYRCNNDDFLKSNNLRKYSSPFSYMLIDYKSSLNFIDNSFNNYFDYIIIESNKIKLIDKFFTTPVFINKNYNNILESNIVHNWEKICLWNHHNLNNEIDIISLRANRLLYNLNNKSSSLMLFCIHKIQNYIDDNINNYIDIDFLLKFNNKYNTHLLFILPLFNYNLDPKIMYNSNNIMIIYLNSFYESNGTAFSDERIKWNDVMKLMNNYYNFNIEDK